MAPSESQMLRELWDRQAIRDLALRYAHAGDRRQTEDLRDIFTADARVAGYPGSEATGKATFEMKGIDTIVAGIGQLANYALTFHLVANHLIRFDATNPERASGEVYCVAHHLSPSETAEADGAETNMTMYIRYQDEYQRDDAAGANGEWRFRERVLLVDRQREAPF